MPEYEHRNDDRTEPPLISIDILEQRNITAVILYLDEVGEAKESEVSRRLDKGYNMAKKCLMMLKDQGLVGSWDDGPEAKSYKCRHWFITDMGRGVAIHLKGINHILNDEKNLDDGPVKNTDNTSDRVRIVYGKDE